MITLFLGDMMVLSVLLRLVGGECTLVGDDVNERQCETRVNERDGARRAAAPDPRDTTQRGEEASGRAETRL